MIFWPTLFDVSPIHPTQLYGAIYTGILAYILIKMLRTLNTRMPGATVEIGALTFSILKFLEEFIRGDETVELLGIRVPQLIAAITAVFFAYRVYKRHFNTSNSGEIDREPRALKNQTM